MKISTVKNAGFSGRCIKNYIRFFYVFGLLNFYNFITNAAPLPMLFK